MWIALNPSKSRRFFRGFQMKYFSTLFKANIIIDHTIALCRVLSFFFFLNLVRPLWMWTFSGSNRNEQMCHSNPKSLFAPMDLKCVTSEEFLFFHISSVMYLGRWIFLPLSVFLGVFPEKKFLWSFSTQYLKIVN